jgi:hypothetical protein
MFNAFFVQKLHTKLKMQNTTYYLLIATEPSSDNVQHPAKEPVFSDPKQNHPGKLSRD